MLLIVQNIIKNIITNNFFVYKDNLDFSKSVSFIENTTFGDISCNIAMILAKELKTSPQDLANSICNMITLEAEAIHFKKIEVAGSGFINFTFSEQYLKSLLIDKNNNVEIILNKVKQKDLLNLKDKITLVEYTDPNPFKVFHIGHLMTNIIGESIANIYELSGAVVKRINYQGDVGRHIAITIFAILQKDNYKKFEEFAKDTDNKDASIKQKVVWLGQMYALGYNIFKDAEDNKETIIYFADELKKEFENISVIEIVANINKKIYERSDEKINYIYDMGKAWSMEYFEILYKILGTSFDKYIMESQAAPIGQSLVAKYRGELFVEGEDGAIVFDGERFSTKEKLHTRVFINKNGLPTYEAKDLGNMNIKMNYYPNTAESVVITANEVNDYFKVINFCITNIYPDLTGKLRHFGHGMMRFVDGKMSSRKGNIIAGDDLIDEIESNIEEKFVNSRIVDKEEREKVIQKVAVAAVKYAVLKQSIGKDIIFDMEKVISVEGDSGPYIQYTYSRLCSVAKNKTQEVLNDFSLDRSLISDNNRELIINILKLEDILIDTVQNIAPQKLCTYLIDLSRSINSWYGNNRIADNKENEYIAYKAKENLNLGLKALGIYPTDKM